MDDLNYRLPPDILHYETKYFLGFGIADLLIAGMAALFAMTIVGAFGLLVGGVALLALKRFDHLGNRSLAVYGLAALWHRLRPTRVDAPRTLPPRASKIEVVSWDGETLYTLEEDK
jgi:hypothetical protein